MKKLVPYGIILFLIACVASSKESSFLPCIECDEILIEADTSTCAEVSHQHESFMTEILKKEVALEGQLESVKTKHKEFKSIKKENKKLKKTLRKATSEITLLQAEIKRLSTYIKEQEFNI